MKFIISQVAYLVTDREQRANLRALLGYLLFLAALVTLYAVLFHVIKLNVEGEQHSWITGFYWTLVVMTTLGFGDVTFTSDIGRFFSIIVLLSGVVFLLVMLPFLFIRLFYAPWLEARVRLRAPREVRPDVSGHVIIAEYDAIAVGLIERLRLEEIPYYVIEPDPAQAARLVGEGVWVVTGDNDGRHTFEALRAPAARLVLATARTRPTPTSPSRHARWPQTSRSWRLPKKRIPSTSCNSPAPHTSCRSSHSSGSILPTALRRVRQRRT